jgi:hypothetical protein
MLMGANDGGIDHLDAVLALPALVQRRQQHIPHPTQGPAPELAIDRVPFAEMVVQIAPGRARSGDPEHPVQHQPVIPGPTTAPRTALDHQRREERPLLIRHQTTNQDRSPQRAALNQRSDDLGIHLINRT